MKIIVILIFSMLLFSINCKSQTSAFKEKFGDADYFFLFEEYSKALKIYQELYNEDKTNANINYLLGLCYVQSVKDKDKIKAIPYLEFASASIADDYKEGKYKETRAPKYSLYYLAFAYRLNNQFDKAIETYKKYISYLKPKEKAEYKNVMKDIESCEFAKGITKVPVNLESVKGSNFSDTITKNELAQNNKSSVSEAGSDVSFVRATVSETYPVVSHDGSIMVFSLGDKNNIPSEVNFAEIDNMNYNTDDIYISEKDASGKWTSPKNIMQIIGAKGKIIPSSISSDKNEIYFVKDDNDNGNIYVSKFENGSWQKITKLNKNINTRSWESHACISADGKTLYFTSARSDGFGGIDIYKSTREKDGDWGKAQNLGAAINTLSDEETPVILEDGKTLFFSSRGHKGIGGFDIFTSTVGDDGRWSLPKNVGYSINTVNNDFAYINKVDNQLAYSPLNRTDLREDFSGKEDRGNYYKLELNKNTPVVASFDISGFVVYKEGNVAVPDRFNLCVKDSASGDTMKNITKSDFTGEYSFNLKSGNYSLIYKAPGYREYTKKLSLPDIFTPTALNVNVELVPETSPSSEVAQCDVIFDYEKNLNTQPDNKVKIDKLAIKQREDSLKQLVAARESKKKEEEQAALLAENKKKEEENAKLLKSENEKAELKKANDEKQRKADEKKSKEENAKNKAAADKLIAEQKRAEKETRLKEENDRKKAAKEIKDQEAKDKLLAENKKSDAENKQVKSTETNNNSSSTGGVTVKNLFFDFDKITPVDFRANLDKLADYLLNDKPCKIHIDGYSDLQGEDFVKQYISERRAAFVKNYLEEKGVEASRITIKGNGSAKQISGDCCPHIRKYNRRIEISIVENCSSLKIEPIVVPDNAKEFAATEKIEAGSSAITISDIMFDFDNVVPLNKESVDKMAAYLKSNPGCEIEITGHSDATGDASFKELISKMRADNIKQMLVNRGANISSIKTKGAGDSKLISSDKTPQSRKYNRRVEFTVIKEGKTRLIIEPLKVPDAFKLK